MDTLTPASRVERMLLGDAVDRIPFTSYENKFTTGRAERMLRNDGMCIVQRVPPFYRVATPNCETKTCRMESGLDRTEIHTVIETSAGRLTAVDVERPGANQNAWHEEHLFSGHDDYAKLVAYARDLVFTENYEAVERCVRSGQGDLFYRGYFRYSPMHEIMYTYMGIERFAFEWSDNPSKVLDVYEVLRAKRLDLAAVASNAPSMMFLIGGNVSGNVVSPGMFREYYLPDYNAVCDVLHAAGKLAAVHFDGITKPYADGIRESHLDCVEALTPPPTCDITVAEAHDLWPDKALWINFPSSVHLEGPDRIRAATREILEQCRPERRFLLGITEDVPADRWPVSFRIILDEVNEWKI